MKFILLVEHMRMALFVGLEQLQRRRGIAEIGS